MLQLRVARHRLTIDGRNHVEWTQITLIGWRIGFDRSHDHAFVDALEQVSQRRIIAERFDTDAKPGPDDFLPGDELSANLIHQITWNGETEATVQSIDKGVHAYNFAVDIAERATAVARVD